MTIRYNTYLKLKEAIKEYSYNLLSENKIDNIIYKHFLKKYKFIIFENSKGILQRFSLPYWYSESEYKAARKVFKIFINH